MAENPRIEELRRRVQLDPASIAFAALAEEFRRMGRHEEAIETCRAGLQRHPAYLSARVTLGRALIEVGEYDAAREELETVLRSAPENLAAIRGLAQIHERLGQSTEMDPHFAAMMNAEAERVAQAAAAKPPPPPPPAEPEPIAAEPVHVEPVHVGPVHVGPAHVEPAHVEPAHVEPAHVQQPHVVDLSNIDLFRVGPAEAAPVEPQRVEPQPVEPIVTMAAETMQERAPAPPVTPLMNDEPEPIVAAIDEPFIIKGGPDPATLATIARLERFLAAIESARHA